MRAPTFLSFTQNYLGRDFVAGDIHGTFDLVNRRLGELHFNPDIDRLFCVGDLIDRHPDSRNVIEFLNQPFVFSVLGNHDTGFSSLTLAEVRASSQANPISRGWTNCLTDSQIFEIQDRLACLPLVMQVQTRLGPVGIIHGEVPSGMSWSEFLYKIQIGDARTIDSALFGRTRLLAGDCGGVSGIERLYVGHTTHLQGPMSYGNVHAIDTGAVFNVMRGNEGNLTIVQLDGDLSEFLCRADFVLATP